MQGWWQISLSGLCPTTSCLVLADGQQKGYFVCVAKREVEARFQLKVALPINAMLRIDPGRNVNLSHLRVLQV